jgi:hypothetical protein
MNKVKEVKTNPKWPLVCENDDCQYRYECANHQSAGDFRTDGGIQPRLMYIRGVLHCETFYMEPDDESAERYRVPRTHYHMTGFCKNPVEIVDDYQV